MGINAYTGHRIDEQHIRQQGLEDQLNSSKLEIEQLKANLADNNNKRLNSIQVYVTINADNLTKIEREQIELAAVKSVKKRLTPLIGQELTRINYRQIAPIIDGREIVVNKQTYQQKTDLIIVKDSVELFITVSAEKKSAAKSSNVISGEQVK